MPYHGYVEIRMKDFTDELDNENILRECLNSKFIGIYRYSEKVYANNNILENINNNEEKKIKTMYSNQINKMFDDYNESGWS